MPHSNIKAAAPAVIAVATLVPVIWPNPLGYIPLTFTPGDTKSGADKDILVGPHDEFMYNVRLRVS
ncbi:hypothetical protein D3C80_1966100 [compost metagenome]